MPRIPHAAKQLFLEINAVVPEAVYEPVGDPDGFGVYRTVLFNGDQVDHILQAVSGDKRIKDVSGGVVEFVSTTNADTSDIFNVAKAHRTLTESEDVVLGEPEVDVQPTLEERLRSMTKAEIAEEFGFESGTKKDMISEILSDQN